MDKTKLKELTKKYSYMVASWLPNRVLRYETVNRGLVSSTEYSNKKWDN